MAPSLLNGLNYIQPATPSSSSQDLIAGTAPFPENIWSTLNFGEDEPFSESTPHPRGLDEDLEVPDQPPMASRVLTSTTFWPPFPQPGTPSIVQLLALHNAVQNATAAPPALLPLPGTGTMNPPPTPLSAEAPPPAKRARARKTSISSAADSPDESVALATSVAEDKRRRNTAASARFRLKKKEREAALEMRAKELEGRVNELERECEGLRRENGWLKGLVVGVTGAAQAPPSTSSLKRGREEA
ncbi:BZIP domain-containing protein [Mycena kentingensis (nom. inval.)]|nr:BZIP domain-containing protein [Mycena kentingensis (nom. inval.)]